MTTPEELTGYSEIGAVLKSAREDRHLSITEAARLLHIRARYLDAIEKGDFTELPGLPYAKGYIQAYAVFLDLDRDELMRRFERVDVQMNKRNFQLPKAFHSDKKPHQAAIWGSLAAVLVLYSLWEAVFYSPEEPVSVVEHYEEPGLSPELRAIASKARNPACFRLKQRLYPLCYAWNGPEFTLVPLRGTPSTVLALWDKGMADAAGAEAQIGQQSSEQPETKTKRSDEYDIIIKAPDIPPG